MRRQLGAPVPIERTWYGHGGTGGLGVPATVPMPPPAAWVQDVHDRGVWHTMVRKPEHAPAGSTVTLRRKRV